MLQAGGANNVTAGCLKETFHHERMAQLALQEGRTKKPRLQGGILPCATPFTDRRSLATASAEYAKEHRAGTSGSVSPRRLDRSIGSLSGTLRSEAYELPHHGIGVHDLPSPPAQMGKEKPPAHGRTGPFGRHSIEKVFYDHVSTGNIACLH